MPGILRTHRFRRSENGWYSGKNTGCIHVLTFLAGARRQIFVAFAVFLLVKKFEFSVRDITLLFVVNNAINYLISPLIGKWVVRYGERKCAFAGIFQSDFHFFRLCDRRFQAGRRIALYSGSCFFQFFLRHPHPIFKKWEIRKTSRRAWPWDFTINHIAAVFFPAVGGALWMVDYRIPFICGAFISLASLIAVQFIRVEKGVAEKERIGGDRLKRAAKRIYLLRHGKTEGFQKKSYVGGKTDIALSEKGKRQALAWRRYFEKRPPGTVYSSGMTRTTETARIVSGRDAAEIIIVEDLREIFLRRLGRLRHGIHTRTISRGLATSRREPEGGFARPEEKAFRTSRDASCRLSKKSLKPLAKR